MRSSFLRRAFCAVCGIFRHACGTGRPPGDAEHADPAVIPLYDLSRGVSVLAEDDNTMDAADKALINDFILDEAYRDYDPGIADPVKRHTNTYVARYRSGEFIRVYLHR